jgi:hypothetical protein
LITWAALLLLTFGWHSKKLPDAHTIIQRSVQANERDWDAFPKYEFDETDYFPGGHTRTYHVTMVLGSPYEQLMRLDGKPLSPAQSAAEQHKMQQAIEARRNESAEARARRVSSYQRDRDRDHLLMKQLTVAFNFKLIGEQKLGPYNVYVLKAKVRPGYHPPNREAEVLTGMEGELWIDEQTFQWVKVEAHVIQPVTIEGFLAKVEPGTRFELEKMPAENGIWVRQHFAMRSKAKVLFLFSHDGQEEESYSNYKLQGPDVAMQHR